MKSFTAASSLEIGHLDILRPKLVLFYVLLTADIKN